MSVGLFPVAVLIVVGLLLAMLLAMLIWHKPLLGGVLLVTLVLICACAFMLFHRMRARTLIHPAGTVVYTGPDGVKVTAGPAAPVRPDTDGLLVSGRTAPAPPPDPRGCSEEEAITGGTLTSDDTSFRIVQMIRGDWDGNELVLRLHLPLEAEHRLSKLEYLHAVQADGTDYLGDCLNALASAALTEDSRDIQRVVRKLSREVRYRVAHEMFMEAWADRQITAEAGADAGDGVEGHDITVSIEHRQLLKALRDARVSVHRNRPPTAGLSAAGALALVLAAYLVLKISTRWRRVGRGT